MSMPFTTAQFLDVFARYNEAVWPAQLLLVALAVVAAGLALRPAALSGRVVSGVLAFFWAWMGVVYHGASSAGSTRLRTSSRLSSCSRPSCSFMPA
jgi:DMSO/TMAO reductase YedYZ heme-binding membrane subunit